MAPPRDALVRRAPLAAAAVIAALLLLPATGRAATVSAVLVPGSANSETLAYLAAPGEKNDVAISVAEVSETGVVVTVSDSGAAIEPGAGCVGGGAPGTPASCQMETPRSGRVEACGHDCFRTTPGTEWVATLRIELGDEDDALHGIGGKWGSKFQGGALGQSAQPFRFIVGGGAGADTIKTGAGDDTIDAGADADQVDSGNGDDAIDAGPGPDHVESGAGNDKIESPAPDGDDIYEMGSSESFEEDLVTYEGRSGPISLDSFEVTTAGETDELFGVERITAGAGADQLHPGSGFNVVSGSGGDDVIDGSADLLNGRYYRLVLDGGAGSDRLYGGEGGDTLWGREGDDVAVGRAGNDLIELGQGDDQAQGGPGDDTLKGDIGDDVLEGESGEDRLVGQAGSDRLRGGEDGDELYASRAPQPLSRGIIGPVDTASDDVDCEEGEDFASVNPWDRVAACERVRIVRAVDIRRPHRVGHGNRWLLPLGVSGAGTVTLSGAGVEGASREVRQSRPGGKWSRVFALRLRLTRPALLRLGRLGSLQVHLTVSFLPPEGVERTAERTVKLVDRRD
jgi:hypothetical protein